MVYPQERKTGKTRHRLHKRLFGEPLWVLQVEITYTHTINHGSFIDCETRTTWRDALPTDMGNPF